jgi:hypothetical protein
MKRHGGLDLSSHEEVKENLPHEAFEHLPENVSDKSFEAVLVELKR